MATKKKTKFAILGLLNWKPMSGYDIKKLVDVGLSHFWNENYGQIYPTLQQLVDEKLANQRNKSDQGKRPRYVYSITAKGRRALKQWIAEPTEPPVVRNELQLKFFLSGPDDTLAMVQRYRSEQLALQNEYQQSERVLRAAIEKESMSEELADLIDRTTTGLKDRQSRCQMFFLTLRHGIRIVQARIDWCDEVIATLDVAGSQTARKTR